MMGSRIGDDRDGRGGPPREAAPVNATHTVTIEVDQGADGLAGRARGANGAGVPFAGWLGLIAALDGLLATGDDRCFADPTACCPPLAAPATAISTHDPKETTR
jgi:hypothetical protein